MAEALARRLFDEDAAGAELGPLDPAGAWRVLNGEGLEGVMLMSSDARATSGRYGFFAFSLAGRGVFEGIYNVKPGGREVIGVFWPDGKLNQGTAAGFMELSATEGGAGAGGVNFTGGGEAGRIRAR